MFRFCLGARYTPADRWGIIAPPFSSLERIQVSARWPAKICRSIRRFDTAIRLHGDGKENSFSTFLYARWTSVM